MALKFQPNNQPVQNNNWFSNLLPAIVSAGQDAANYVGNTAQDWANVPGQIIQSVQGKPITPNSEMTPSQLRGQDLVTTGLLTGQPEAGAVEGNVGYLARQGVDASKVAGVKIAKGAEDIANTTADFANSGILTNQSGKIDTDLLTGGLSSNLKRDLRYKQGNPEFKPNGNPKTPTYSTKQETPTSGLTPEDIQPPKAETPKVEPPPAGSKRTYIATTPTKEETLINTKRGLLIDPSGQDVTPLNRDQVNATLNGYGITDDSPKIQLDKTTAKIGELQQQARGIVAKQGGNISKNDLISDTTKSLAYGVNHTLTPSEAQAASSNYINHVYIKAVGADPAKGIVVPDEIPGAVAQDMKTIMNEDAKSTFGQPDSTKWTPSQLVSRHARNATDSLLDKYYPDASRLNNDMSDLYKAEDSLTQKANAEITNASKTALTPPQPTDYASKVMGPWAKNLPLIGLGEDAVNKVLNNPVGKKIAVGGGLVAGGAASATLLPQITNSLSKNDQTQASNEQGLSSTHTTSIAPTVNSVPTSQDQISFDQNGHVGVFNPFNGTDGISKQQYQDQLAAKNAEVKQWTTQLGKDKFNYTAQATDQANIDNAKTDIDTLNALNTKSRSLDTPQASAISIQGMNNAAADDIKNGWSSIVLANGSLNKLATIDNGAYSKLASALKKLQDVSGQQIFEPGMSLDVALANLQQATKTALWNTYYNQFPSQGGYSQLPPITGTQAAPNQLPPITPQTGQNSGTGVPHPFSY